MRDHSFPPEGSGQVYTIAESISSSAFYNYVRRDKQEVNALYIYYYLSKPANGWKKEAIAGLLGNLQQECVMNPGAWQSMGSSGDGNVNQGYFPVSSGQRTVTTVVDEAEEKVSEGSGSVPSDVLSLMNAPIDSTWGISDSTAEAWFLSTNTAVINKYGLNSTNIGEVTVAIKAAGVSPVLFYAYTVNEGGGLGGFINHYKKNHYANNGGDTAVNAASGDAQYLADQSKIMNSRPAWVDLGQDPPNRIDFVPQSVKDSGNASFASMPSGSIGRAYIPATAAATWEVYYTDGLLKSYNQVQNYGAPMEGVLSSIVAMSKY